MQTSRWEPLQLSFVDVTEAYFNAKPTRSLYVKLPPELALPHYAIGKLERCCCGTRDAGALWEQTYTAVLCDMGFRRSKSSPCVFWHTSRHIRVVCHGDDFTAISTAANLNWYEAELAKAFELKVKGRHGEGEHCDKEVRVLNQIIRIDSEGLLDEADPRHAELLSKSLGLENCRLVGTPGKKPV